MEFLTLKGGCAGSFEYIHVKIPHCRKSHGAAHLSLPSGALFQTDLTLKMFAFRLSSYMLIVFCPGRVVQSVTCLATDGSLTAYPGVTSSISAWSHTFVEIDHEIISTVILLPSAESFKKSCCQLQAKVCA